MPRNPRVTALSHSALILGLIAAFALFAVLPFGRAISQTAAQTTGPITGGRTVSVAVAANFAAPAQDIGKVFTRETGIKVDLTFGSSGALFTQAKTGAAYQVFLSADNLRNVQAITEGFGVAGSAFIYARGRLVLFSVTPGRFDANGQRGGHSILNQSVHCPGAGCFSQFIIANPVTAPYGVAATETIAALGYTAQLAPKQVLGADIAATYNSVNSGAVPVGFVALSQVIDPGTGGIRTGVSGWLVPETLHAPINQGAVLLTRGADNPAAQKFITYLKGPAAQNIIARYGYALPAP